MIQETAQIKALLDSPRRIVITTHQNPDGDAMGSSLALLHYLRMKGHDAQFISPTGYAEFLAWMPGAKDTIVYDGENVDTLALVEKADLIFCLDFNSLTRIGELGHYVNESEAKKVVIDHHIAPDDFPDVLISDISACSTAELIYEFIVTMGDKALINRDMAENIYTGILTDTGAFQFSSTTAKVHRIVADMVELGVDINKIYEEIYNSFSESRLRLFGYCITEKLKIYPEYNAAVISLSRSELKKFNIKSGDTEGLVNYPLKISTIRFSALIIDRTELIKISFRSKGDFDVNAFARAHFSGGGHRNAAGGSSTDTLRNTVQLFEASLPFYKSQLTKED